jgi:hypothetical protein
MRVDGSSIHPNPVNPYNAATEKTVAAKRSYQLRKKLAKRATGSQGWAGLDQAAMVGQWMSGGQEKAKARNQRQLGATSRR